MQADVTCAVLHGNIGINIDAKPSGASTDITSQLLVVQSADVQVLSSAYPFPPPPSATFSRGAYGTHCAMCT